VRLFIGLGVAACCLSGSAVLAEATGVHEKQYVYAYGDTVKGVTDDAFLVCAGCKSDSLAKVPKQIVSVRVVSDNAPAADNSLWRIATDGDRVVDPLPSGESVKGVPIVSSHSPVLFSFDSDVLTLGQKKQLDDLVGHVSAGSALVVEGYTCSIGSAAYNKGLSMRRASHVAGYLKKKGGNVVRVEGKGKCCPVSKDKKLNRRVEIIEKENH
jgi:outer membrane protein OmpA-like peptidoglycan-associated protein